jgi:hypothetical protein
MKNPPQIIARAFKNEPVVLYAHELQASGRHVNVDKDGVKPIIGWPLDDAFDYDIDDFDRLWTAYSSNDAIKLAELYREMRERPKNFVEKLK